VRGLDAAVEAPRALIWVRPAANAAGLETLSPGETRLAGWGVDSSIMMTGVCVRVCFLSPLLDFCDL
jgi:hypothetical protein